jgi:hypothetical protein
VEIIAYEITCSVLFQLLVAVFSAGGWWVLGNCYKILGGGKEIKSLTILAWFSIIVCRLNWEDMRRN